MLSDFFRINLPYGIEKNDQGEWTAFNREYLPLGFTNKVSHSDLPIYTKYQKFTEAELLKLAHHKENGVQRDSSGEITKVFLYNDGTNPRNQSKDDKALWDLYFSKLKKLSQKQVA